MKYLTAVMVSFVLTSCMHPIMQDHHDMQESYTEPILQKEVTLGNIKAVATFPPMVYGRETVFTLRLMDSGTSEPISGAKVSAHIEYEHRNEPTQGAHDADHPLKSDVQHEINWNQEVEEAKKQGTYSFAYTCYQPGDHKIVFHVTSIGEEDISEEIVIEATRSMPPETHERGEGMMGMGGATTAVVFGAVAMGVMMVAVLMATGRMH